MPRLKDIQQIEEKSDTCRDIVESLALPLRKLLSDPVQHRLDAVLWGDLDRIYRKIKEIL